MVKLEKRIIDGLYNASQEGSEEFLDSLGDGLHLNSTRIENGERVMLFEDGEGWWYLRNCEDIDIRKELV